jgi:hypothetical protein
MMKKRKRRRRRTHHNGDAQTFLKYASYKGQIELVKYLLGVHGLEVNAVGLLF